MASWDHLPRHGGARGAGEGAFGGCWGLFGGNVRRQGCQNDSQKCVCVCVCFPWKRVVRNSTAFFHCLCSPKTEYSLFFMPGDIVSYVVKPQLLLDILNVRMNVVRFRGGVVFR